MGSNKRLELRQSEKDLLQYSAGDLIPMLEAQTDLIHVKQSAYGYYCAKTKEIFQVQVIVTRCENDFLEPFTTETLGGGV